MVLRLVVDDETDVDPARARVERDVRAHGTRDARRRAREAVRAQPFGQLQCEIDRGRRAVAGNGHAPRTRELLGPDGRTGVGIRVLVALVSVVDEQVLAPAARAGLFVHDQERPVRGDLDPQMLVLDDALVAAGHARTAGVRGAERAESVAAHARGDAVELDDGVALPG